MTSYPEISLDDKNALQVAKSRYEWSCHRHALEFNQETYDDASQKWGALLKRLDIDDAKAANIIWNHILDEREEGVK